ncbi:GDSL esterase/lipase At5g41890 isoform X3 [Cannabis sativa]|uniref:GDSL esterase/lipase At5g41890 isoform X3 n=1 Tax=Cannabis sativa TaxID=3483 RepID=UPI0029C9C388|nr:GDSL esterase/lipase At5g41890 isoform X3 [Cannabis sativa]
MESTTRFIVIVLLVVVLICCNNNKSVNGYFTSFVFGDSLVDAGNNDYLFTLSKANLPPYGIDFKPSGGKPTGRFTNGRTISDIVGEVLGGKSFPPPYLAPNSEDEAVKRGINYASGASGILDQTGQLFIGRVPLREQVKYFEETKMQMVNKIGDNRTNNLLKKAIFSITIGSNDVLNYFQPSIPFFGHHHHNNITSLIFQDFMLSNLTLQLKRLQELGGRKFVVVGIGPLGCIPFIRALNLLPSGKCSEEVNELIKGYNNKLNGVLDQLNKDLAPQTIFVYANSYDIFLNIIQNHQHYVSSSRKGKHRVSCAIPHRLEKVKWDDSETV